MHITKAQNLRIPFNYIQSFKITQSFKLPGIKRKGVRLFNLPDRGYFNYSSAGVHFLNESEYERVQINPFFHMVNGYRFNEKYGTGIGMGLDNYVHTTALPLYLTIRRDLFPSRITPVLNANLGYGWMWGNGSFNSWDEFDRVEGGLYWEVGMGVRMNLRDTALILNWSCKNQNAVFTKTSTVWWTVSDVLVENQSFRNMTLSLGVEF